MGNCKIELVEEHSCNNRTELERQEGKHIRRRNCINKVVAGRTRKEWYDDLNEYVCLQQRVYRELHSEKRKEEGRRRCRKKDVQSEQHLCGCGKYFTFGHKKQHEKSQKHQDWIIGQNNQPEQEP